MCASNNYYLLCLNQPHTTVLLTTLFDFAGMAPIRHDFTTTNAHRSIVCNINPNHFYAPNSEPCMQPKSNRIKHVQNISWNQQIKRAWKTYVQYMLDSIFTTAHENGVILHRECSPELWWEAHRTCCHGWTTNFLFPQIPLYTSSAYSPQIWCCWQEHHATNRAWRPFYCSIIALLTCETVKLH